MTALLCIAGDAHGLLDTMYRDIADFERQLGQEFEAVLHVGDFGIWPGDGWVDQATLRHDGAGDFPAWFAERRPVPRRTVFIRGNHEHFMWLDKRQAAGETELLPGLHYLPNGEVFELKTSAGQLRVGGLGGNYGPGSYGKPRSQLRQSKRGHFSFEDVEQLKAAGRLDLVLFHDAPAGFDLSLCRANGTPWRAIITEAQGLNEVLRATQPQACFFGHYHRRLDLEAEGIPCHCLQKVSRPESLAAIRIEPGATSHEIIGRWPEPDRGSS